MKTIINDIILSSAFITGTAFAQAESANPAVQGVDGPQVVETSNRPMRSDSAYPNFETQSSKSRAEVKQELETHKQENPNLFISA